MSASAAAAVVPRLPGIYAIFVNDPNKLPNPFRKEQLLREKKFGRSLPIYIGISDNDVHGRLLGSDLGGKRASTFFRAIGAILGFRPPAGSLREKKNQNNYKFSPEDAAKIVEWNAKNLVVSVVQLDANLLPHVEFAVIQTLSPILNTTHNPSPMPELAALRTQCREIARKTL